MVTQPERVRVDLAGPAASDLELHTQAALLAGGTPRGKSRETIDLELEPGTYLLRVRAPEAALGSELEYRLKLRGT